MDKAWIITKSLVKPVQKMRQEKIEQPTQHATALAKLAEIFKEKTEQIQRVESKAIQTSATSAAPAVIHNDPHMHQRKTQANTPGILPPNSRVITTQVSAEEATVRAPNWYETPRYKRAITRVRKMALSKRKFTTISKPAHVPGRQKIIYQRLCQQKAGKVHNPNLY